MSSQQLTPRAPAHIFKVNSFDIAAVLVIILYTL